MSGKCLKLVGGAGKDEMKGAVYTKKQVKEKEVKGSMEEVASGWRDGEVRCEKVIGGKMGE